MPSRTVDWVRPSTRLKARDASSLGNQHNRRCRRSLSLSYPSTTKSAYVLLFWEAYPWELAC